MSDQAPTGWGPPPPRSSPAPKRHQRAARIPGPLLAALITVAFGLALVATVYLSEWMGRSSPRPGDAAIYERIEQAASCGELRALFQWVDTDPELGTGHRISGPEERGPLELAYRGAIADRRNELGCSVP